MTGHTKPPAEVGPEAVFDGWIQARALSSEQAGTRGLKPQSVEFYRVLWLKWAEWLAGRDGEHLRGATHRWIHAQASDAKEFLGEKGALGGKRPVKIKGQRANFTRRLYWQVLRDVYAYAIGQGLRQDNPIAALEAPTVQARDRVPQYVEHHVLEQLRNPASLRRLVQERCPDWLASRDRATIALVAHLGLTASELQQLRMQDLRLADGRQGTLDGVGQAHKPRLDVAGRSLDIPPAALRVLTDWLEERKHVVSSLRTLAIEDARTRRADPSDALANEPPTAPLLLARDHINFRPAPMPASSVTLIFHRVLKDIRKMQVAAGEIGDGDYRACGPAAIRNSVIRDWVLRLGAPAAARMAGVKEVSARHRVASATPPTKQDDPA